ncbi:MAG: hypothetical protein GX111_13080 [Clostridiales bacterium]|nr:hypothetical protein [Clostridiales bacterium]
MKTLFYIAFILFCLIHLYLIVHFTRKKQKLNRNSGIAALVFFAALLSARLFFSIGLPYVVLVLSLIAVFLHNIFGYYLKLYEKSRVFDRYLHAFGAFTFALLVYFILGRFIEYGGSRTFLALYVLTLGVTVGTIFELFEFCMDIKEAANMQKGLRDTNTDMLFNLLGSFAAAVCAFFLI